MMSMPKSNFKVLFMVSCVIHGVLVDCGSNCLQVINKLLPGSLGLIHLSHDHPHTMRQDLALSFRATENHINSLLTKPLADTLVGHSTLVQVYSLVAGGQIIISPTVCRFVSNYDILILLFTEI